MKYRTIQNERNASQNPLKRTQTFNEIRNKTVEEMVVLCSATIGSQLGGSGSFRFYVLATAKLMHSRLDKIETNLCISHLRPPHPPPPHSGLSGGLRRLAPHKTSFWFPGRRGIRLKSRSSHPLPGYLLAAQRSICLFHGCQQCFLTSV